VLQGSDLPLLGPGQRNKGDDTVIRKLMRSGVDVRFTLARYDRTSAGELHMDIDGMFAEHHSRVTREKVTLTIRSSVQRAYAPIARRSGTSTSARWRQAAGPKRAPIIARLFELYATVSTGRQISPLSLR